MKEFNIKISLYMKSCSLTLCRRYLGGREEVEGEGEVEMTFAVGGEER